MKKLTLLFILFCSLSVTAAFDEWFYPRTLRIDYYRSGDRNSESITIDELISERFWGGSKVNLIDTLQKGEYYFRVYDLATNVLIYSRGYCSLFAEWQFTEEAKQTRRSFTESVVMPFPRKDVRVVFLSRNRQGDFSQTFEYIVDVESYFIRTESRFDFPVYETLVSGDPSVKIDIFSRNRDRFNIRGVIAPSLESGTDIPGEKIWKKTMLNSRFYTFDSERYLMTFDNKSVRDLAANVPYDQIYILVNSTKYGGGAIYNHFNTSVNSNSSSAKIFVHELGHGFAGLADEYDDGSTAFNDIYPLDVEPWEENITTLVHFEKKWKDLLPAGTPIPTPANNDEPLKLGVYEGGGYVARGIYRPVTDCLMRSFKGNDFCPVCQKAIQLMIDFYSY